MEFRTLYSLAALALASLPLLSMAPLGAGDFRALPGFSSRHGVLRATLTATAKTIQIDGATIAALTFNGEYAGPVLRLSPGDRLELRLVNRTFLPVNIHFHGSYASPLAHGDNVHVVVQPGAAWTYQLTVPRDQPPGLYYYHAHIHGLAEQEVGRGLSGAMIIAAPAPARTPRSRLLVLKTFDFPDDDTTAPARLHGIVQSINGAAHTQIDAAPGATELWRISNQSPNDFYHLTIAGASFQIVATDGAPANRALPAASLDIPPAGTMEALVTLPRAGATALLAGSTPTGTGATLRISRELAAITLIGPAAPAAQPAPAPHPRADLRQAKIAARRTVVFTEDADNNVYMIDGKTFDHARIDIRVPLGAIEEWTIRNDTDDMHVFHIHQVHFQLVAINGVPQPFDGVANVVRVPERGSVTLRIAFTDPQIVGRFMYHCHVLKHEDQGMMANIEVYLPGAPSQDELGAVLPATYSRALCFTH